MMERLTYDENQCWQIKGAGNDLCEEVCKAQTRCAGCPIASAFDRLAAYEDTGLTPEEIEKLKSPCDLCAYGPPSAGDGKPCAVCPACRKNDK